MYFYDLPSNANDTSYQLWILRGGNIPPESAGVFDITESGRGSLVVSDIEKPEGVKGMAVTLEPKGGLPQPSNLNFFVIGQT